MPQLAVNMKVNTQNKVSCKLKVNSFKLRHAPYTNRCGQARNITTKSEKNKKSINLR